jgi:hypothetical protein
MHISWVAASSGFAYAMTPPPPAIAEESLMKSFEVTGKFWLPHAPEKKYWGQLMFSPGSGVEVIIEGNLVSEKRRPPVLVGTLYGQLYNGAICSIFDVACGVETYYAGEQLHQTRCDARSMIDGIHCLSPAECKLENIQVKLTQLNRWFEPPYEVNPGEEENQSDELTFNPSELVCEIEFRGVKVKLSSFSRKWYGEIKSEGKNLNWNYDLVMQADSVHGLDWYFDLLSEVRKLFVFLIGAGVFVLRFIGGVSPRSHVTLYYPATVPRALRYDADQFSTRFEENKEALRFLIPNWFSKSDSLRVVFDSYSELLCSDGTSPMTLLIRTIQTLEHFYGIIWGQGEKYVAKGTYKQFLKWIGENLPSELKSIKLEEMKKLHEVKSLLLSRFGNLNDISLRSKLEKFISELPRFITETIFKDTFKDADHIKKFLDQLEATRHYHTHYDPKLKPKTFNEDTLEEVALVMWALLSYWLSVTLHADIELARDIAEKAKEVMFLVGRTEKL